MQPVPSSSAATNATSSSSIFMMTEPVVSTSNPLEDPQSFQSLQETEASTRQYIHDPQELMLGQFNGQLHNDPEAPILNSSRGAQSGQDGSQPTQTPQATTSQDVYVQELYFEEQPGPSDAVLEPQSQTEHPWLSSSMDESRDSNHENKLDNEQLATESKELMLQPLNGCNPNLLNERTDHDSAAVSDRPENSAESFENDNLHDIQQATDDNSPSERVAANNVEQVMEQQQNFVIEIRPQDSLEIRRQKIKDMMRHLQTIFLLSLHSSECDGGENCLLPSNCKVWRAATMHGLNCNAIVFECPERNCDVTKFVRNHFRECVHINCFLCYPFHAVEDVILSASHPLKAIIIRIMYLRQKLNWPMLCTIIDSLPNWHDMRSCSRHYHQKKRKNFNMLPCPCKRRTKKFCYRKVLLELQIIERELRMQLGLCWYKPPSSDDDEIIDVVNM